MNASDKCWNNVTLHFMRGLPRAGKSTHVKKLVAENDAVVVSGDAIRMAIYDASYDASREKEVFQAYTLIAKSLLYAGHKYIVFDGVFATCHDIDDMVTRIVPIEFIDSVTLKATLIDTPVAECVLRALRNNQGVNIVNAILDVADRADWHSFAYEHNKLTPRQMKRIKRYERLDKLNKA